MSVENILLESGYEDTVYFTDFGYDDAIIGIDVDNRAVYDYCKMVNWLIEEEEFSEQDAIEWIDYNTIRALPYIDSQTNGKAPIIMHPIDW